MNTQKGFAHAILIIGLVVALLGALGFIFWQNFIHNEPTVNQSRGASTENQKATRSTTSTASKPTTKIGIADLTAVFPDGWSGYNGKARSNGGESVWYAKTVEGVQYTLRIMYKNVVSQTNNGPVIGATVDEIINPSSSYSLLKTTTTNSGMTLYIVKPADQGQSAVIVSSTQVSSRNTPVSYGALKLGIIVEAVGEQAPASIDFSSNGANEIINDLSRIISSLNI